jgi:hypothetical protein
VHCWYTVRRLTCAWTCAISVAYLFVMAELRLAVCRPLSLADAAFGFHALTFLLYSKVSTCQRAAHDDVTSRYCIMQHIDSHMHRRVAAWSADV